MKKKSILGVIVCLVVILFVGNKIAGNYIAKEIDAELQKKIENKEIPAEIAYEKVSVSPLFSKVKFTDVEAIDENIKFECDAFNFKVPYNEALRLAQSTEFEELKSIKLIMDHPVLSDSIKKREINFDHLVIDFEGHITVDDIENMDDKFPEIKQKLQVSFADMLINTSAKNQEPMIKNELQKQLKRIDKGNCTLIFDPETHEIHLENMSISSDVMSVDNNSIVHYSGNGWSSFKTESMQVDANLLLKPKEIEWGEGDDKGTFSLSKLSLDMASEIETQKNAWPYGSFSLSVKNLKASYAEESGKKIITLPIGISIDEIDMEKFEMNYALNDGVLNITDTELKSNFMDATLEANVEMLKENPKQSPINSTVLKIQELSPELESTVLNLEKQFGVSLPREDGQIILELEGTLGSPKIKGLGF